MIAETRAEIEGYAALFQVADLTGDRIKEGAFGSKLIPAVSRPIRMLYQHQAETPIGRWTDIQEDKRGLHVKGEIFLDTERGHDVYRLIQGGAIDGLSIGFKTRESRPAPGGRQLLSIDLWEVSVVTFPMSPLARIERVSEPGQRLPRNLLSA